MLKNIRIGPKLVGGFIFTSLIALLVGLVGIFEINSLSNHISEIGAIRMPGIRHLLVVEKELRRLQQAMRTLMSPYLSMDDRQRQYDNIVSAREEYDRALAEYEKLARTDEEKQGWSGLTDAISRAKAINSKALDISREIERIDILNPDAYMSLLQMFTGDPYRLEAQVSELLLAGKEFEGGEDSTACRFGKWMAGHSTSNPELAGILLKVKKPHDAFHESVRQIKQALARGD